MIETNKIFVVSLSFIIFGVHYFHSFYQLFWILHLHPLSKRFETKTVSIRLAESNLVLFQKRVEMIKDSLIMFGIKYSIDNMANKQFEFKLNSDMDILSDILMRFSKDMSYNQSIRLFEIAEILSLEIKLTALELEYLDFA